MRYLLDTTIISDVMKPAPSDALIAWMGRQDDQDLFIASLTIAETRRGVIEKPAGKRRRALEAWFAGPDGPQALFAGRVLPFDEKAALAWARLMADGKTKGRPRSALDTIIAAVAEAYGCTVVTANEKDFAGVDRVPQPAACARGLAHQRHGRMRAKTVGVRQRGRNPRHTVGREEPRHRLTAPPNQEVFLGSTGNGLFLRPDLRTKSRRPQGWSSMAEGHRTAARSVLDQTEHGGFMKAERGRENVMKIMVATLAGRGRRPGTFAVAKAVGRRVACFSDSRVGRPSGECRYRLFHANSRSRLPAPEKAQLVDKIQHLSPI